MAINPHNVSQDNGPSVQQRILDALRDKVQAMTDNGKPVWRKVEYGDLENIDNVGLPVCGIDFGTEEYVSKMGGCANYDWPMFFHFRYEGAHGLEEQQRFLYYLALLKAAVLSDHTLGGLTIDVQEDSSAHTIIGIEDTYPGGTLAVVIKYRTRLHKPYTPI